MIASLSWMTWENPVSVWWVFLTAVSALNICILIWTWKYFFFQKKMVLLLSTGYVLGCAFRSFLPRADVQRICLFDTWFSNVLVGRSVATFAELCFVAQWALILKFVAASTGTRISLSISKMVIPIIVIAELFSWYAVISTHYLGNTVEESLWAVTYSLIALGLFALRPRLQGALSWAAGFACIGSAIYILFMVTVDVPMYISRWQADVASGKEILGFVAGITDLNNRWVVTHDIQDWKTEIPWMSLYFSIAVWTSLALCYVPQTQEKLKKYLR